MINWKKIKRGDIYKINDGSELTGSLGKVTQLPFQENDLVGLKISSGKYKGEETGVFPANLYLKNEDIEGKEVAKHLGSSKPKNRKSDKNAEGSSLDWKKIKRGDIYKINDGSELTGSLGKVTQTPFKKHDLVGLEIVSKKNKGEETGVVPANLYLKGDNIKGQKVAKHLGIKESSSDLSSILKELTITNKMK